MPTQLEIEDLNLSFEDKVVLHDVAVTAKAGHILALMGKSGSGKTTLLHVVNRMVETQGAIVSGRIMLGGSSIFTRDPVLLRREVGLVPASPVLFSGTVLQNISAGLKLQGVRRRQDLEERAVETLTRMGILQDFRDMLDMDVSRLTLSQGQLVCMARALALQPGLLLLDEPTRLVDTMTSLKMEEIFFSLKKECTMVIVVHAPQQAGRIADETAMMEDGTVLEWGKTSDLFYHPTHLHTEAFISGRLS